MPSRTSIVSLFIVAAMLLPGIALADPTFLGITSTRSFTSELTGGFRGPPPVRWVFFNGNNETGSMGTPTLYDIDGDGVKEVFVTTRDGHLWALDGNGIPLWNVSFGTEWWFASPAVGDIDGDGRAEVVFGGYYQNRGDPNVYAVNAEDGSLIWKFDTYRGIYIAGIEANPVLVDVNGDGCLDVLLASDNYNLYILDGTDGTPIFRNRFTHFMRSSIPMADIDLDGRMEFLASDNHAVTRLFELDGTIEWEITTGYNTAAPTEFAQLDDDPELEIVVFNVGWPYMSIPGSAMVYEHDGTLKWENTQFQRYYASPTQVDVDGDGLDDLVAVNYFDATLVAFRGYDGRVLWTRQMPNAYYGTSPVSVDIDGDGVKEILLAGRPDLYAMDSRNGDVEWVLNTSGIDPGGLLVADLEDDGSPEIFFTNGSGYLYCLGALPPVEVEVDFHPCTFNLRRHGKVATVYVEFPPEIDPADVDMTTILLNGVLAPISLRQRFSDIDGDGIPELVLKFSSNELDDILPIGDPVLITITGNLNDGTPFIGTDSIRVISHGSSALKRPRFTSPPPR